MKSLAVVIKHIRNLYRVEFDRGRFDYWCVYVQRNGEARYAPNDTVYFTFFKHMGDTYGYEKVYTDFLSIYQVTTTKIDNTVLDLITKIADTYTTNAVEMDCWLTVIYGGMIAEENKANMVLKKRIKNLGMYQVLMEGMQPEEAAKFSFGKKWRELDELMKLVNI